MDKVRMSPGRDRTLKLFKAAASSISAILGILCLVFVLYWVHGSGGRFVEGGTAYTDAWNVIGETIRRVSIANLLVSLLVTIGADAKRGVVGLIGSGAAYLLTGFSGYATV